MISEKTAKKINETLHQWVEDHGLVEVLGQVAVVCAQRSEYKLDVTGKPFFVALDKVLDRLKKSAAKKSA